MPSGFLELSLFHRSASPRRLTFSRKFEPKIHENQTMQEVTVTIRNRAGVHTRPAAMIVKLAAQFKSNVFLTGENNMRINAKSIIGVMTLAAGQGTTLTLFIEGVDEEEASKKLRELFESGFGEQI